MGLGMGMPVEMEAGMRMPMNGFLLWGGRGFEMSNKCFKLHELALFVISPSLLLLSLDWFLYLALLLLCFGQVWPGENSHG